MKPLLRRVAAALCVAAIAGAGCWWVYNRYFSERANPSAEEYPLRGIDISAHNGDVDATQLARQGVAFVYLKATEGTDFADRHFARNAAALRREGIPAGAYHFFRFDTDGELQGWNFLNALRGRRFELPPAIDLEEWSNPDGFSTRSILRELRRMIAVLEAEGHTPVIYTNKDGYRRFVKGNLDDYPLWICSFTNPPLDDAAARWEMWQYSHRGAIDGVEGYVDCNAVSHGSLFEQIVCDVNKNLAE